MKHAKKENKIENSKHSNKENTIKEDLSSKVEEESKLDDKSNKEQNIDTNINSKKDLETNKSKHAKKASAEQKQNKEIKDNTNEKTAKEDESSKKSLKDKEDSNKKEKKNNEEKAESKQKNKKAKEQTQNEQDPIKPVDTESPFDYSNVDEKNQALQPVKEINFNKKPKKRRKKRKIWKILLVVFIVLLCAASVAGAALYSYLNASFDDDSDDALRAKDQLTEASFDEPFYMVLVGTDTRAESQDSGEKKTYSLTGGRSDTCILVRIDPKQYVVSMLSIPRDTQVTINGRTEKFNAAYNYGGIASTIEQVKKLCNVDVAHYAEVSFNGMTDMVDAVGGVDVNVPSTINDPKSGAPVESGLQHLNGDQALSFARSRNFADGDFTRSADQRVLIEALINKAYNLNVTDLPNVLKAAKNFVKTDLKLSEMIGLAVKYKNAEQLTMYSSMVPSTTGTVGGASYCFTDKEALARQMKMMENGENIALVEITSGAATCSSRDKASIEEQQKEYYATHPDSPGRATSQSAKSTNEVYNQSPSGSKSSGGSGGTGNK